MIEVGTVVNIKGKSFEPYVGVVEGTFEICILSDKPDTFFIVKLTRIDGQPTKAAYAYIGNESDLVPLDF